jgi:hypothetical protein
VGRHSGPREEKPGVPHLLEENPSHPLTILETLNSGFAPLFSVMVHGGKKGSVAFQSGKGIRHGGRIRVGAGHWRPRHPPPPPATALAPAGKYNKCRKYVFNISLFLRTLFLNLLFIAADDMLYPPHILVKLVEDDKDVVGAVYRKRDITKTEPANWCPSPELFKKRLQEIETSLTEATQQLDHLNQRLSDASLYLDQKETYETIQAHRDAKERVKELSQRWESLALELEEMKAMNVS